MIPGDSAPQVQRSLLRREKRHMGAHGQQQTGKGRTERILLQAELPADDGQHVLRMLTAKPPQGAMRSLSLLLLVTVFLLTV